jgi:chromosome segregation ATPase
MSSDDVTQDLTNSDKEDNTTQPTITAVFRLLREVREGQTSLNSRLDTLESSIREVQDGQTSLSSRFDALESRVNTLETSVNTRFDALESRLDRDFASVDTRFAEMSDEMKAGLLQLSDKLCDAIDRTRVHAEADIENIARRLRKLESKAS